MNWEKCEDDTPYNTTEITNILHSVSREFNPQHFSFLSISMGESNTIVSAYTLYRHLP